MKRHDTTRHDTVERMTPATVDIRRTDGGRRSYMDPVTVDDADMMSDMVRVRVYTVPTVERTIMEGLADIVDGATIIDGRGWWMDPDTGRMVSEHAAIVEVVTDPATVRHIVTVSRRAGAIHGETAVMVTVDPVSTVMLWMSDGADTVTVDPVPEVTDRRTVTV